MSEFKVQHASVTPELAARFADELEVMIGEVMNGKRKANRLPVEHMIGLIQFARASISAARATPSPAPIQQAFAWIIVRDSTGEHDGGEPMTDKAEADDYMENRCLPGWHLEALYRIAPTVKASQSDTHTSATARNERGD